MAIVHSLVEGDLDEAVAIRIIQDSGHTHGVCYGKAGFGYIKKKVQGFNQAVHAIPYLTLVDFMDTKLSCPAEVITQWLPHRSPNMLFRVVVPELESWLLADRVNLAKFLHISSNLLPQAPEQMPDPKLALINLARRSLSARVRSSLVPDAKSTAQVGKLYTSEMKKFINDDWDVQAARGIASSLDKCLLRLAALK